MGVFGWLRRRPTGPSPEGMESAEAVQLPDGAGNGGTVGIPRQQSAGEAADSMTGTTGEAARR